MPKDNEAPVEVIQGEARARLQAMADENSVELAYGAFQHRTATMITDVRKLLAFQSEAPAQGEGLLQAAINQNDAMRQELAHVGNLVSDLARAMGVDQANADGSWPDLAGRILRLQDAALATRVAPLPLADREAIAREVFRRTGCSEKCAGDAADAILALSGSLPPSPVGEGI